MALDTHPTTGLPAAKRNGPKLQAPGFRTLVVSDIAVWRSIGWGRNGWLGAARLLWSHPGLQAVLLYRLAHALHRRRIPMVPQLLSQCGVVLYGFDIPASVPVGPGLYVPHPVGTVVMAERIGSQVTLVSGITIGMRNVHRFPIIGDRVYVGAGARVLGGIRIGDDASIGANAVVLHDVPDNAVAVGVPATVRQGHRTSNSTGERS
jgi:serine O-acetyltransferase